MLLGKYILSESILSKVFLAQMHFLWPLLEPEDLFSVLEVD